MNEKNEKVPIKINQFGGRVEKVIDSLEKCFVDSKNFSYFLLLYAFYDPRGHAEG